MGRTKGTSIYVPAVQLITLDGQKQPLMGRILVSLDHWSSCIWLSCSFISVDKKAPLPSQIGANRYFIRTLIRISAYSSQHGFDGIKCNPSYKVSSQRVAEDHNIVVPGKEQCYWDLNERCVCPQAVQCYQNVGGSGIPICRNIERQEGFLCISLVLNGGSMEVHLGLQESGRRLSPYCEDTDWSQRAFPQSVSQIAWTACMPGLHNAKRPHNCTRSAVGTKW